MGPNLEPEMEPTQDQKLDQHMGQKLVNPGARTETWAEQPEPDVHAHTEVGRGLRSLVGKLACLLAWLAFRTEALF